MTYLDVVCSHCQKQFRKYIGEVNRSKRRGMRLFCSLRCNGLARRKYSKCLACGKVYHNTYGTIYCSHVCSNKTLGKRQRGAKHPNWRGGSSMYRANALREHGAVCNRCGYCVVFGVLEVHHKDRDHTNVALENLEVLCPTCHRVEHFCSGDGNWTK